MNLRQGVKQRDFWLALLRGAAAVLLLIWLAWLLAETVWLAWQGPTEAVPQNPQLETVGTVEQARGTALRADQVRSWALFGNYQPPERAASDKPVEAPETRLRLELLGVFQTGDHAAAGAIISEQGGESELYRPGQALPGNATLEEVYADRVILRRQGRLETLKLKQPSLSGEVSRAAPSRSRSSGNSGNGQRMDNGGDAAPGLRGSAERQRKQIISGLGLESTDGGYRISESAPAEVIGQVGLQPGDVIVSVNGHEVGEEEADLAAIRDYHDTRSATVVVQRGAQRFTVTVPP